MSNESRRDCYDRRLTALKAERSTWDQHWRELGEHFAPRSMRFNTTDRNKGTKRNDKIINSAPIKAMDTLAAGMSGGMTSPARPWFRLTLPDPDMAEIASVRSWLHIVEERIRQVLQLSNVYSALPVTYSTLGTFGTDATLYDSDPKTVIRAYSMPVGSYYLAASHGQRVDTFYRVLSFTAAQLASKFGKENCADDVQKALLSKNPDQWFDVVHLIEPNDDIVHGYADRHGMAFRSVWYETCRQRTKEDNDPKAFLHQGGYHEFPVLAPRWRRTGEDVYGSACPGMNALGDAKALQLYEKRKAQIVELLARPPMQGPSSLRSQRASMIPGDTTFLDAPNGQKFEPSYTPNVQAIAAIQDAIAEHRERIQESCYADLWMMMNLDTRAAEKTAREVAELHEEKMLQLGPVLESLHDELLSLMIDRVFNEMWRFGLIPPPPPELQGVPLRVEEVSILAQAQKLIHTTGVERVVNFVGLLAQVQAASGAPPDITDVLDFDKTALEYSQLVGVKPDMMLTPEQLEEKRAARAEQMRAAQAQQQLAVAADATKKLAQSPTDGKTALTDVAAALGPPASQVVPA